MDQSIENCQEERNQEYLSCSDTNDYVFARIVTPLLEFATILLIEFESRYEVEFVKEVSVSSIST